MNDKNPYWLRIDVRISTLLWIVIPALLVWGLWAVAAPTLREIGSILVEAWKK